MKRFLRPSRLVLLGCLLGAAAQGTAEDVPTLTLAELRAKHELASSRYLTLDGVDVHYADEGEGPAIVLLHASYQSLLSWERIAQKLKSSHRVVRFDFPNAGMSGPETKPVPPEKFDLIERNYDFLLRFVDELGLKQFVLVGTSSGGSVAFRFAARHPERLDRLVLINSAGMPRTPQTDPFRYRPRFAAWAKMLIKPKEFWAESLSETFIAPHRAPAWLIEQQYDFGRREEREERLRDDYVFTTGDTRAILEGIRAPTLIMWGKSNPIVMHLEADVFAFWMTGAPTLVRKYEGLGHYPYIEDEAAILPDLEVFLRGDLDGALRQTLRASREQAASVLGR